jgi:hypothetical protein
MSKGGSSEGEGSVIRFPPPAAAEEHPPTGAADEGSPPWSDRRTQGHGPDAIVRRHPAGLQLPDWEGAVGDHYCVGPRGNGYAVWLLDQPGEPVLWFPRASQLGAFLAFQDLESQDARRSSGRSRSYLRRRPLLVVLAAFVVLLGTSLTLRFAYPGGRVRSSGGDVMANGSAGDMPTGGPSTPPLTGGRQLGAIRPGPGVYVSQRAGYAFSYPQGWGLLERGTAVRLVGPNGDAAISFRPASDGAVGQASTALLGSLSTDYRDIQLQTPEPERTEQGLAAVVVGARATGPDGRDIRFVSITIHGATGNWAIVVRFAAGSDVLMFMPAVRQIVDSFQLTEA